MRLRTHMSRSPTPFVGCQHQSKFRLAGSRVVPMLRLAAALGVALLLLGATCDGPRIISLAIADGDQTLEVGETTTLTASVVVTGGASAHVVWSTSDDAVVAVDAAGLVTAVAAGTATVTATSDFDDTKSDAVTITVTTPPESGVESVTIDQPHQILDIGDTRSLTATVIVTGDASTAVTWTSDDDAVTTVDAAGLVTAVAAGTATVTATSDFDDTKSDAVTITVTTPGEAAIVPSSSDCAGSAVGSSCQVVVQLENNALAWAGAAFEITNPRFTLIRVTTGSLTAGCLASAGPAMVGIICASEFDRTGPIAIVDYARESVGSSTFTVSSASLIDAEAVTEPVQGGSLAVP